MSDKQSTKKKPAVNENIQLVKIAFPKKRVVIDVGDDLGLSDYTGVKFVMWADPSITVLARIINTLTKEEPDQSDADNYFDALHELMIDSNIEGVDFSTVTSIAESVDHPSLPWGFIMEVATMYCVKVISESNALKKMFGLSDSQENSGELKSETASESIQS